MFQKILILFFSCHLLTQSYGQQKNVLFLGNSYTSYNVLPQLTSDIANSLGDTINWDSNTPGGYTFQGHSTNSTSLNKISVGNWDHVILQEQSQLPSFPPSQVATDCFPYASILVDSILSSNPCAEPIFYMTWGRENGDQTNCVSYPPICTYDGMQARLRESYLQMSVDNNCSLSPVGAAWKYIRDNYPAIGLYTSDGSHPSIYGSYLAACVHYATLFRKSPVGSQYFSSLSNSDALILQQVAKLIVIDSLQNWRIGANDLVADFTYQINGTLVDFSCPNQNINSVFWDFGGGNNSTDFNTIYDFQNDGIYPITLIVSNNCESDTLTDTITISTLNIPENELNFTLNQSGNTIKIDFQYNKLRTISLVDVQGKLLSHSSSEEQHIDLTITKNILCFLTISEGNKSKMIKLFSAH